MSAITRGTPHFVNLTKACDYYRDYIGFDDMTPAALEAYVKERERDGEIHFGKPDAPVGGTLRLIDGGCRYAIEEA